MISKEIFFDVTDIENLEAFAEQTIGYVLLQNDQAGLITLSGDLGSGKTTFTQKLGEILAVRGDINSPTYVIEQRYPITNHKDFNTLVHIDAYRLEEENDPQNIGLDLTMTDPGKLVVIEWPEKIEEFLKPYKKIAITFSQNGDERKAQITENSL